MSWGVATQNGVSVSLTSIVSLSAGVTEFSPADLFTGGTVGAWYDPSDVLLNWRTNLLTWTQEFDNAAWIKLSSSVTSDSAIAPDGTLTADKFVNDNTVAAAYVYRGGTASAGSNTFSVYAKAAEKSQLHLERSGGVFGTFNLLTGSVISTGGGAVATITAVGSGWYRCSISFIEATSGTVNVYIGRTSGGGDGTSGIYIWGAQLELGSTATTYQAITTPEQTYLLYDPQPVLYQDSAGATPVTAVEQPVRLMLDKSQGLVLGANAMSGSTAFAATLTGSVDSLPVTVTATGSGSFGLQKNAAVADAWYEVLVTWSGNTGNRTILIDIATAYANSLGSGTSGSARRIYRSPSSGNIILYGASGVAGDAITFTQVSVRQIAGNHALAPNDASRPVLRARKNWLVGTNTLATQTVTTRAIPYVLSFYGTGSITLSGTATGTLNGTGVNDRVYVDVTPTAGTLTVTVTGTVTNAQLEFANEPA